MMNSFVFLNNIGYLPLVYTMFTPCACIMMVNFVFLNNIHVGYLPLIYTWFTPFACMMNNFKVFLKNDKLPALSFYTPLLALWWTILCFLSQHRLNVLTVVYTWFSPLHNHGQWYLPQQCNFKIKIITAWLADWYPLTEWNITSHCKDVADLF